MAWNPVIDVNITLNTSASSREGFGIPLFIAAHNEWEDRVRSYNSLNDVANDFPTTSKAYAAARSLFSQIPRVTTLYIGRRGVATTVTVDATNGVDGKTFTMTIEVNRDKETGSKVFQTVSYIGQSGDEDSTILNALKGQLESKITDHVDITVGTGAGAVMTINNKSANDYHRVENGTRPDDQEPVNLLLATSATDTAADTLNEIESVNNDWYFVASDDHGETFVTALAKEVEARTKLYFVSLGGTAELTGEDSGISGQLNKKYLRTIGVFHHLADVDFPEMAYIGFGAPYDAGSITWGNARLSGVEPAQDPLTGKVLSTVQKANLDAKNFNVTERDGGIDVTRRGITNNGEWIDTVRGVDWLTMEMKARLRDLLFNQKGGKIKYDAGGIGRVEQVISSTLQAAVNRDFLTSYTVVMPKIEDISFGQKATRILEGVEFTGYLAGAIHDVRVNGNVTYEDAQA